MGYTKTTQNLKLPQWVADDHPDFLTDINNAFKSIDDNAGKTAGEIGTIPQQVEQLTALTQSQGEDITTLQADTTSLQIRMGNAEQQTAQVPGLQTAVQGLQGQVAGVESNISSVQSDYDIQVGKYVSATETSYDFIRNADKAAIHLSSVQRFGALLRVGVSIPENLSVEIGTSNFFASLDGVFALAGITNKNQVVTAPVMEYQLVYDANTNELIGKAQVGYNAAADQCVLQITVNKHADAISISYPTFINYIVYDLGGNA